jgi:iron complex transport system substrate-binding protein
MRKRFFRTFLIAVSLAAVFAKMAAGAKQEIRIVSLAPSTTEILFALGSGDNIVGLSDFCDYPAEALSKEKVGTFSQPNIEKILSLKPDIVFATGLEQAPVITKLRQLHLKVYASDPSSLKELYASIIEIAVLVGKEEEGKRLVASIKTKVGEIRKGTSKMKMPERPKVFVEIWSDPLMTAGKGSLVDELVSASGGINIAGDVDRPYTYFSAEEVVRRDPDIIILTYMGSKTDVTNVAGRFGWKDISAVRNGRVYNDIEPNLLIRPGPRVIKGLEELCKRIKRYEPS